MQRKAVVGKSTLLPSLFFGGTNGKKKKQSSENQLCCPLYFLEGLMARKSRYREYLNAVRNVKVLSKAPQRRTTHEPIRKRLKELKQAEKAEKQGGGSNCGFWFIDIRSAKPSSSACISGAQPDRPRSVLGGLGAPLNERLCLLGTSRHCLPLYQEFLLPATFYFIIVQNYRYD